MPNKSTKQDHCLQLSLSQDAAIHIATFDEHSLRDVALHLRHLILSSIEAKKQLSE